VDTERLHAIIDAVLKDLGETNLRTRFDELISALSRQAQQPQ